MTRHVLVRADGDARIGLGHILRTMSVADELARTGTRITYLCRAVTPWAAQLLQDRGHRVQRINLPTDANQTADARATATLIKAEGVDTVLLDHYDLTGPWTEAIKSTSACKIAAFDDLATQTRNVDLLVDTSPGRQACAYHARLPAHAICLAGPTYAPLRPEFALARAAEKIALNGPIKVVISMGGSDPSGFSLTCLDALDGRADVALTVILSSAAPMLAETKTRVAQMAPQARLLLDRTDMAAILADADLVIGAGGTSALERCALGLPSVLAVLADNQTHNAAQLAAAGAAVVLPALTQAAVRATVTPLLENATLRHQMGQAAATLCDGLGAPRVANAVFGISSDVALRAATPEDMALIHALQSEPGARRFARTPQIPTPEEHAAWYTARLARADRDPFYIVTLDGVPCGFVRLDRLAEGDGSEVSILIAQNAQGQGVARRALGLLRLTHPKRHIVATVHAENTASQHLFERAGYRRTGPDQFTSAGWNEIAERQKHED